MRLNWSGNTALSLAASDVAAATRHRLQQMILALEKRTALAGSPVQFSFTPTIAVGAGTKFGIHLPAGSVA
jgi:hypothetical protein